jgi:midasin
LENNEPALLIGETGIGKTTACQMLAARREQKLHILNCNQHTETSDFLGGYRPNRSRKVLAYKLRKAAEAYFDLPSDLNDADTINSLMRILSEESSMVPEDDRRVMLKDIESFHAPFEWVDGPLITAMKNGDILLIDELNLAEDAVLERLNR